MISDKQTNAVYLAEGLQHYMPAFKRILDELDSARVHLHTLPLTKSKKHIWARDYKDSTDYPGDDKIVGSNETLTFQLYHIRLKGAELDYPKEAYTMAIYVPKELAATYTSNEQYNIDDSDDEEDEE